MPQRATALERPRIFQFDAAGRLFVVNQISAERHRDRVHPAAHRDEHSTIVV